MSLFIDVHCHLDFKGIIERLDEVIKNAEKAGLKAIVSSGITPETNKQMLEIAKKYPIVKPSFGLYPMDALTRETDEKNNFDVDTELEFWEKNKDKFVSIGEVGLDYKNGKDSKMQKEVFQKVLETAKKLNKPVIIHSRKAESDALDILESSGYKKVIMHCFSGKKHLVKRAYDLGYSFSIPTNVVRLQQFQDMVKEINISNLFCETDAPFLSPFKDQLNEPAFVVESYKKIAELKRMELEEVEKNIWMNYQRMFT
ncbi:MAG: TatD family hydrolase [Nanoarchaeota archaeon]|nr:TatD family hydrolase [Nanoarchaeota archaeon]MBU1004587.1 TatD family hydrolase [Nanoarchaeota archaeon]MBU1946987.1 TatD family hydrolase [Nanoarchaeota archaeon]